MAYSTADEVKKEHLAKLGPELGPVFHELHDECAWLNLKWQQFVMLYGTDPESIDILNQTASLFFRIVQDTLWESVLLDICALTDPKTTLRKENLTIQRLPLLIADASFRTEISDAIQVATQATEFARDWRNRKIAHRDLPLAIEVTAEPLEAASRQKTQAAIDAICKVIKMISAHYFGADIQFIAIREQGDGEDLLNFLKAGTDI